MKRHLLLPLIGCAMLFTGCIGTHYTNTEAPTTLQYLYDGSEQNLSNLSKRYGSTLNKIVKEGTPKPGACADYAVTLAKLNKAEDANKWLNKEASFYPSAIPYVNYLKKTMIPEFADDTIAYTLEDIRKQTLIEVKKKPAMDTTAPKKNILERAQESWKDAATDLEKQKKERKNEKLNKDQKGQQVKAKKNEPKIESEAKESKDKVKAKDEEQVKANEKKKNSKGNAKGKQKKSNKK